MENISMAMGERGVLGKRGNMDFIKLLAKNVFSTTQCRV